MCYKLYLSEYKLKWFRSKCVKCVSAFSLTEAKIRFIKSTKPDINRISEKLLNDIIEVV